jgi:transcriptional regulator with XRE-family HTH domain
MPKQGLSDDSAPAAITGALLRLGANIETARLRRRMTLEDLAARAGISRETASRVEAGRITTSIGAYAAALWVLGLLDPLGEVGSPNADVEGATLAAARLGQRARPEKVLSDDF